MPDNKVALEAKGVRPARIRVRRLNPVNRRIITDATDEVIHAARHLFEHALPIDDRDDRFSDVWADEIRQPNSPFVAALACDPNGHPVGLITGSTSRGRLQLDALVSDNKHWPSDEVLDGLLCELEPHVREHRVDTIELWGRPAFDWHDSVATAHGMHRIRSLHQMRCSLPTTPSTIATRAFVRGTDEELLREVNNRAFAGHPDQGNLSVDDLERKLSEPWNRDGGIRLYEQDGQIAGFCWTKIHEAERLGEIYAIGVHPDFHGQRLGVPMTAAGLDWLSDQGLTTGMLYVEGDNEPAIRTYRKLGFDIARTDMAWERTVDSTNQASR